MARHGYTPDFRVVHGVIVGTQQPWGHGGLLITDKKYRNFELSLEVAGLGLRQRHLLPYD